MSASEEELEFSDVNSVNSKLSWSPSYEIEEENNGPSADLSTSDGEEDGAAFAEEPLADAEWTSEYQREKYLFKILGTEMHRAYHGGLRWLPFGRFCFIKSTHFFLCLSASGRLSSIKWNHVQRYTLSFVFLVAVTSRSLRFADKISLFINPCELGGSTSKRLLEPRNLYVQCLHSESHL